MNITQKNLDNGHIQVSISGNFDAKRCAQIRPVFEELIDSTNETQVVLNLRNVEFLDSSGIGAIVFLYKRLKLIGSDLKVVVGEGQPREILQLLRVDNALNVVWKVSADTKAA